jgi:choline dehydrogenase
MPPIYDVIAARLSADPQRSVLLIEAGPDYGVDPQIWPDEIRDPTSIAPASHPWGYVHTRSHGGEPLDLPRARILGGSAAINAVLWMRGSRADYDAWAAEGNLGWSFDDLRPYFRRVEHDPLAAMSPLHGGDGPVPVFRITEAEQTSVESALVSAADELGLDWLADLNGSEEQRPAIGPSPRNIANGVRMNPAFTYLAPIRDRRNLTILSDTLVNRIIFDGVRARGIETADGQVILGSEVILSSGAYGSPAILLRSGVGPRDHLDELGIPIVHTLPGVGEQLMDHPKTPTGWLRYYVAPEAAPSTGAFIRLLLAARSHQVDTEIDLHLYPIENFDKHANRWCWQVVISLMYSRSMGQVRLTSRDPEATLAIDHNYFAEPADLEALCDGVELTTQLANTRPLAGLLTPASLFPAWMGREELRAFLRETTETTFHPSTTCKMGPVGDPMAVVDQAGRVYGVDRVRVVDASVFPSSPRCNLHFPVCAVAEKLADAFVSER